MKKVNKTSALLAILATTLGVFASFKINTAFAEADKLNAGKEISITGVSGNLDNINVKIEFTTSVNLDGTNNALLVGLASSDDTILTDERFVAASTNTGVYDSDNVAVSFENAPLTIGSKAEADSNYTYTIETRDFTVVDATKNIAKLVVIGQKGAEITTEFNFSEVKYSVKFGDAAAVSYSYNEIIADPASTPAYVYDFDGHQAVTGWIGNDSSAFASGTTKATKDITYTVATGEKVSHSWNPVAELGATETVAGVKAHYVCACGAIKLNNDSTTLATEEDLIIAPTGHTCTYAATFDWSGATNPGDKPAVTYTCTDSCGNSYNVAASDITITETARNNATCKVEGSVTYEASCTYEGVYASDEKTYVLPIGDHELVHHDAVAPTLENTGNKEYWSCSECNDYFLDAAGTQTATLAEITLAKYTLEEPQRISVSDLKYNSVSAEKIKNESKNYDYSLDGAPTYKSIVFAAKIDYKEAQDSQIYIYGDEKQNWNGAGYIWVKFDRVHFGKNGDDGVQVGNYDVMYPNGYTMEAGKTYSIEYGRLAIMDGDTFTGKYHVYFSIDGDVKFSVDQAIETSVSKGGRMHFTGSGGFDYVDINYEPVEYETPDVVSIGDLKYTNGSAVGDKLILSAHTTMSYEATAAHKSVVFNFLYEVKDPSTVTCQIHFKNGWLEGNGGMVWLRDDHTFISKANSEGYVQGDTFTEAGTYNVELGKLYITSGKDAGKYYIYAKIGGTVVAEYINDSMPDDAYIFTTGTNGDCMYDVDYEEVEYETPDEISIGDLLKQNGDSVGNKILLTSHSTYLYTATAAHKSVVFSFVYETNDPSTVDCQIHFKDGWLGDNHGGIVWLRDDKNRISKVGSGYLETNPFETAGTYEVSIGKLYVESGENAGRYYIYLEVNGNVVLEYYIDDMPDKAALFMTGTNGDAMYDVDYVEPTYEEADIITVSNLKYNGQYLDGKMDLLSNKTYQYDATTTYGSVVFKGIFNFKAANFINGDDYGTQIRFFDSWDSEGMVWFNPLGVLMPDSAAASGYQFGSKLPLDQDVEVEMARLAIMKNGVFTGKHYFYVKLNGVIAVEYTSSSTTKDIYSQSCMFFTGKVGNGENSIKSLNYVAPTYEEADVISVNDLVYAGAYQNGSIDLLENRFYTYNATATYGSVVFKGIFNFKAESFVDGDNYGAQMRFNDSWTNDGMIWFNPIGVLLFDANSANSYKFGSKLPLDQDVEVEIGRLAIMQGDEFTGKHYFYVKLNGSIAAENITSAITEEDYQKNTLFITGKPGNGENVIKNVSLTKTVTVKVGEYSQDIEVQQSGLVTIPEFDSTVIPSGKRIVGWVIEGTETAFNPATSRISEDIVIVAVIEDFKWKVTFETEDLFFDNGSEIVVPEENPTKIADATNHYVFDCWVDEDGNPFVAGTIASKDATYTAKFTAIAHTFDEWVVVTEPTCTTDGLKTRTCECGYVESATIPATHKLTHVEAVAETCTTNGNVEYWICSECNKMFADEEAKTELADVVILAHGLTHHDAVEPTCTKNGTIEYWECETCHKYYTDANATNAVESIIDPKRHDLVKVEAVAPTCTEDGNIEYYHCNECGKNFDANGNQLSNLLDPATGHSYGEDGKCSECGEVDPNYVAPVTKKGCKGSAASGLISLIAIAGLLFKRKNNILN